MLAGNLCRCTGYGPIIAAAARPSKAEPAPDVAEVLRAIRRSHRLELTHNDALHGVVRRWFRPARSLS